MKKKFTYKDIIYKGKRLTVLGLIVLFGAGLIFTSTMNSEIPIHDGDVLVDSLAIKDEKNVEGTFEERRAKLEIERNKLISTLDSTINSSNNEAEKNNASGEKARIMKYMEQELAIEDVIESKNLPDCFVLITESSVNVTVDMQELDNSTVAKICDVVMRETGRTADKVVIQSKF